MVLLTVMLIGPIAGARPHIVSMLLLLFLYVDLLMLLFSNTHTGLHGNGGDNMQNTQDMSFDNQRHGAWCMVHEEPRIIWLSKSDIARTHTPRQVDTGGVLFEWAADRLLITPVFYD